MSILEKQNEKDSLDIQATARLLYNKANNLDMIQWIIVLALPILKLFFFKNIFLDYAMIIWFFLSFILDFYIDSYTNTAAELKKSFDYYVYGWNNKLQGKMLNISKNKKAKKSKYFIIQTSNSGTDEQKGVKNWYTTIENDMSEEESIKAAMKENIYFDKQINKTAFIIIVSFLVLLFIVLAISGISFYEVLFGLFVTFASFTKKLYSTLFNLKKVYTINNNIEEILCDDNINLKYLQSEIDKKRSISGTSNKIIYHFQSKGTHKEIASFK